MSYKDIYISLNTYNQLIKVFKNEAPFENVSVSSLLIWTNSPRGHKWWAQYSIKDKEPDSEFWQEIFTIGRDKGWEIPEIQVEIPKSAQNGRVYENLFV